MDGGIPSRGVDEASTILASLTGVVLEIMRFIKDQTGPSQLFQIRQMFGQNVVIDDHPSGVRRCRY